MGFHLHSMGSVLKFFDSELRTGLRRFSRARQIFMLYRVAMRKNGSDDPWTRAVNGVLFLMLSF